jgi:hypothetical protein
MAFAPSNLRILHDVGTDQLNSICVVLRFSGPNEELLQYQPWVKRVFAWASRVHISRNLNIFLEVYKNPHHTQTNSGVHPASYKISTAIFSGVKQPKR